MSYVAWRLFYQLVWQRYFRRSAPLAAQRQLKKRPRHLLIRAECLHDSGPRETGRSTTDAVNVSVEHGIEHLTILGSPQITRVLLLTTSTNIVDLYENHRPIRQGEDVRLRINVVTEDQQQFFVQQLKRIAVEEPEFRFTTENLLSKMTCFPQADLIISTTKRFSFAGCLPSQIGFAEVCHLPGEPLNRTTFEQALQGYASCRQNFGK